MRTPTLEQAIMIARRFERPGAPMRIYVAVHELSDVDAEAFAAACREEGIEATRDSGEKSSWVGTDSLAPVRLTGFLRRREGA